MPLKLQEISHETPACVTTLLNWNRLGCKSSIFWRMEEQLVPVHVMLPLSIDEKLESIMEQLGLRSKGAVIERLLAEVFDEVDQQED